MRNYEQEVETILALLHNKKLERTSPHYIKFLDWLGYWPSVLPIEKKDQLILRMCETFSITEDQLLKDIAQGGLSAQQKAKTDLSEQKLRDILPKGGWFEWYDIYTRETEAPLSFHIFSSLSALGTAMGRRCFVQQGHWQIFPNYCTILIGPTGRVHKTTAINISRKLVEKAALCPTMAEQMTPEAFINGLIKGGGHQYVCIPEFSSLFNRQRYNDGLTTKVIRMLDSPESYKIDTMSRGEQEIQGLALTITGGSTLSLLMSATPAEVMSSGFLNRFILIIEDDTDRCFPEAGQGPGEEKLLTQLKRLTSFRGAFRKSEAANKLWDKWYRERRQFLRNAPDEMTAEVLERTPDHVLRTSLLMHAVQCDNQTICEECLERSIALMAYIEQKIPSLISSVSQSSASVDTEYVLEALSRLNGASDHSKLFRRVSHRVGDATSFRRHISTLVETHRIKEEKRGALTFYTIIGTPEVNR